MDLNEYKNLVDDAIQQANTLKDNFEEKWKTFHLDGWDGVALGELKTALAAAKEMQDSILDLYENSEGQFLVAEEQILGGWQDKNGGSMALSYARSLVRDIGEAIFIFENSEYKNYMYSENERLSLDSENPDESSTEEELLGYLHNCIGWGDGEKGWIYDIIFCLNGLKSTLDEVGKMREETGYGKSLRRKSVKLGNTSGYRVLDAKIGLILGTSNDKPIVNLAKATGTPAVINGRSGWFVNVSEREPFYGTTGDEARFADILANGDNEGYTTLFFVS